MTFRCSAPPFAVRLQQPSRFQRLFHNSARLQNDTPKQNHYETLQIPVNATPTEVKKSFYSLSKTHHPDRNPEDPNASHRFVQISEAYAILGTPAKRQAYDREHIHPHHHGHSHHHGVPTGSYSSSGPAGGRSPSGLSKRRTQFRGPPPSFYRSGGWGEHSAKRKAAQENGAPGAEAPPDSVGGAGGMGPGQRPWGHGNHVPHFDREGHIRTHENHTKRWQRRRGQEDGWIPSNDAPRSMLANFIFVGGILSIGIFVPTFILEKFVYRRRDER